MDALSQDRTAKKILRWYDLLSIITPLSGVSLFSGALKSRGIVAGGWGRGARAREGFFKTGSKAGPSGAF